MNTAASAGAGADRRAATGTERATERGRGWRVRSTVRTTATLTSSQV